MKEKKMENQGSKGIDGQKAGRALLYHSPLFRAIPLSSLLLTALIALAVVRQADGSCGRVCDMTAGTWFWGCDKWDLGSNGTASGCKSACEGQGDWGGQCPGGPYACDLDGNPTYQCRYGCTPGCNLAGGGNFGGLCYDPPDVGVCGSCTLPCQCPAGNTCISGLCLPPGSPTGVGLCGGCTNNCQCASGRSCIANRCLPAGSSTNIPQCAATFCSGDCQCQAGSVCNLTKNRCIPTGGAVNIADCGVPCTCSIQCVSNSCTGGKCDHPGGFCCVNSPCPTGSSCCAGTISDCCPAGNTCCNNTTCCAAGLGCSLTIPSNCAAILPYTCTE